MKARFIVPALLGAVILTACGEGGPRETARSEGAGPREAPVTDIAAAPAPGLAGDAAVNGSVSVGGSTAATGDDPDRPVSSTPGDAPAAARPEGSGGGTSGAPTVSPPNPGSAQPVGTAANDILERAERAYAQIRTMEADFVQEVYVPLLESTQHSRGKLFHRAPDRFLMRFSQPQGDIVVADGRYIWMYYPSNDPGQVMRARLSEGGQQVDLQREFLSDATSRFNATRTGGATIGGREAHALTLVPREASPYSQVRLWVDAQDHLVRRFEITEQNGTIRKLEMSGLRANPTLAADLFEFEPPPNVQIFEP